MLSLSAYASYMDSWLVREHDPIKYNKQFAYKSFIKRNNHNHFKKERDL